MILRTRLCIPVYKYTPQLQSLLVDILDREDFPILIVDDGSPSPISDHLNNEKVISAIDQGRLEIIRHEKNQGKGAGIQTAIKDSVARGFTHLFTIDGDGQHLASEIAPMIQVMKKNPWNIIIGQRTWTNAVPDISRFGRKFSNFWVKYQTGFPIKDSQSGLRIYPLFSVQNFNFWTSRYDFEIEILIKALWHDVAVTEVPVKVFYPPEDERISHFDKFWDNIRISFLNILLIMVSLVKDHTSPMRGAAAFATGIFVGTSPFYGLHTAIIAGLSFVGRLNFPISFLASNVSLPPFVPFIVGGSLYLGSAALSLPLPLVTDFSNFQKIQDGFQIWFVGWLLFGSLAAIVGGGLWFAIATFLKRKKDGGLNWSGKMRGGKVGNKILIFTMNNLGLKFGYLILLGIIPYFYIFAPRARKGLNEYWSTLKPGELFFKRQFRVLKHLFVFAQVLMDRIFIYHNGQDQIQFKSSGYQSLTNNSDTASEYPAPLLLVAGHMGHWELAAQTFNGKQTEQSPFHIIEFFAGGKSPEAFKPAQQVSKVRKISFRPGEHLILKIHRIFENKGSLALMGDRPLDDNFELVPFLGKLAPFPSTPFRMAMSSQAHVLHAFSFRTAYNKYKIHRCEPYLIDNPDSREEKVIRIYKQIEFIVDQYQKQLAEHPYQWFNLYPFWSSMPTLPIGRKCKVGRVHLIEELQKPKWNSAVKEPLLPPNANRSTENYSKPKPQIELH